MEIVTRGQVIVDLSKQGDKVTVTGFVANCNGTKEGTYDLGVFAVSEAIVELEKALLQMR